MKLRLGFDTTSAATIADSDSVGAFVRSSDGTLITHTTVGADEALDVNVANDVTITAPSGGLDVNVDGVYAVTTNETPDTVGAIVHVRAAAPAASDQTKRTTGAALSADAVVAADVHGLDVAAFGHLFNGTTYDRARSYGTGIAKVADLFDSIVVTAETVGTTAAELVSTPATDRVRIKFQNLSNRDIYIGPANTVTVGNGYEVSARSETEWFDASEAADFWAIGDDAGLDVRVLEAAVA